MSLKAPIGAPLAVLALIGSAVGVPAPLVAQTVSSPAAGSLMQIATGRGRLVTLSAPASDVFVADDAVADVQVRSPTQVYIFGKKPGETTVSVTTKSGKVVFASTVRVGNNIDSIGQMLKLALPDADITATVLNGVVLLTGTVQNPDDINQAVQLVTAFVGANTKVVARIRTATPLQVNLQVRFAEVSRSFIKNIGVNNLTRDTTSGFQFGASTGTRVPGTIGNFDTTGLPTLDASSQFGLPAGSISLPFDPKSGKFVYPNSGSAYTFNKGAEFSTYAFAGKLLGLDVLSALDIGERIGQVTTLTNPNVTVLSGQTGSFLAGGEVPIPISQGLGAVSVEYKQYGVSLTYTPTVLSDGRISLHVKPEVSQLDYSNAVQISSTAVPALTTRRADTTVELGSGQSFMIAGLMQNNHNNSFQKTPGVGDVPVLGALFRSNAFQRNETELVIVITPYLVKPVNDGDIKLPTDGYQAPDDFNRVFMGQLNNSKSGADRPKPRMDATPVTPSVGLVSPLATPQQAPSKPGKDEPQAVVTTPSAPTPNNKKKGPAAAPGFSLN